MLLFINVSSWDVELLNYSYGQSDCDDLGSQISLIAL